FDDLLQRIHPAPSCIRKLSREHPAIFMGFDLLAGSAGKACLGEPLRQRRARLEAFAKKYFSTRQILLSPATTNLRTARQWLKSIGPDLDGIIAKRLDSDYRSGERTAMQKIKLLRTADCVIGGFRYSSAGKTIGSLLLGLYDG